MPRRSKENNPTLARPRSSRSRKLTARLQQTRDAQSAAEQALLTKKRQKVKRQALKQRHNESALIVERAGDTDEVRELRAALARAQGERNAAEAANHRPTPRQGPADRSIARPSNMSKVKIEDIRSHLNLSGARNDQKWTDLRAEVRRFMSAGLLDLSVGWKEQDNRRLMKVYDAIEDAHPGLKRFRGQWAVAHLVHETLSSQKTYGKCKVRAGTYRSRHRGNRRRPDVDDDLMRFSEEPNTTVGQGHGPLAPSHSSSPSPSPLSNNSPVQSRPPSRQPSLPELTPEPEQGANPDTIEEED